MLRKPINNSIETSVTWFLFLIPLFAVIAFGQVGDLEGEVRDSDTNNPIEDVAVILEADTAWTDINGSYQFTNVPVDTYEVRAEKYGYDTEQDTAVITAGSTTELDFFLRTVPIISLDISSLELDICIGQTVQESFTISNLGLCNLTYELEFIYGGMILNILVVDDDGGPNNGGSYYHDVQNIYTEALDSARIAYDLYVTDWSISPEQPGPDVTEMEQYDLIIWFTGECWGLFGNDTLTPEDEINLGLYLDEGGAFFLSSQDYFYTRYPEYGTFFPGEFPYDYLGVTDTEQDRWTSPPRCEGGSGSFAQGTYFPIQSAIPGGNLWTDKIEGEGTTLLHINGHSVALQNENDVFKSVFTALSFEALVDTISPSTKVEFLQGLEDWVLGELPDHSQSPQSNPAQIQLSTETDGLRALTDEPWLTCSPQIGDIVPNQSQLITLNFNMPDTAQFYDVYEGIIIINNNSLVDPVQIPIIVNMSSGIPKNNHPLPLEFALHQNYPNPFNPTTTIRFELPQSSHVNLSIYNILGQEVAALIDRNINAGTHQITFDGTHLTSGLYFYSLKSGSDSDVKKMLLLK